MSETSSTSARSSGLVARAFLFTRTRPLIAIALHLVACVVTAGAAKDFLLGASLRDAAVAQAIMASCIPGIIAAQCVQPASRDRELCCHTVPPEGCGSHWPCGSSCCPWRAESSPRSTVPRGWSPYSTAATYCSSPRSPCSARRCCPGQPPGHRQPSTAWPAGSWARWTSLARLNRGPWSTCRTGTDRHSSSPPFSRLQHSSLLVIAAPEVDHG